MASKTRKQRALRCLDLAAKALKRHKQGVAAGHLVGARRQLEKSGVK